MLLGKCYLQEVPGKPRRVAKCATRSHLSLGLVPLMGVRRLVRGKDTLDNTRIQLLFVGTVHFCIYCSAEPKNDRLMVVNTVYIHNTAPQTSNEVVRVISAHLLILTTQSIPLPRCETSQGTANIAYSDYP